MFAFAKRQLPMVALWAGCHNVDAEREDMPGGLFLDRNRLSPEASCIDRLGPSGVDLIAAFDSHG
ncbi:MAG: hypothetical protein N838_05540 [Thiohalocapsa sp. PB-PSB1]|nr:MAG: hypothetical protein N838_05540 [Thiohalocapsa sp. PB-PSB1]